MTRNRTAVMVEDSPTKDAAPEDEKDPLFQRGQPGEINYWPGLDKMMEDVNDALVKAYKKHAEPEIKELRKKDPDLYLAIWKSKEHGLRFVYVKPGQKKTRPWWAFLFFWVRWD